MFNGMIFGPVAILLLLIVILIIYGISMQRNLVSMEELTKNALSQIGVQQNSRWDALTALIDLTKGYAAHEYNTLKDLTRQRVSVTGNSPLPEVESQENILTQTMGRLMAVAENYPDLKANETYLSTMNSLNQYENNVRMSRMVYNDTITKMNRLIRQFPGSIIAGILGFQVKEYLKEPEGKTEMPSMK